MVSFWRFVEMPQNPQRRTAIIFWILSVILLIAIFIPEFFGVGLMNGGFVLSALALLGTVISLIVAMMYRDRARALDRIVTGKDLLTHWKYGLSENEHPEGKKGKHGLPSPTRTGEAYITLEGVYLNGQLHLFTGWGARLEKVTSGEEGRSLSFTYSVPVRGGRSDYVLHVPVPLGKEEEARQVISSFQNIPYFIS
jgi:uncharacterized membrane protein (DUF485 family)